MNSTYKPNSKKIVDIKDEGKMVDKLSINKVIEKRMQGGPKGTHIKIINKATGEVIDEGHNMVMLPGSQQAACKLFGLDQVVPVPTYNSMLGLDHTLGSDWSYQPYNDPIICLWAAGRNGYNNSANEVNALSNLDYITPDTILPFRYVPKSEDLPQELRSVYFGRKTMPDSDYIAYYFKAPDTKPLLHIRYLDGTEVTSNLYSVDSSQIAEIWVESRLSVTRNDFRDYFDLVLGWDNADFSTISLLIGWYDNSIPEDPDASAADAVYYKWYQDVIPYSKWNFKAIDLTDLTEGVSFIYEVYF